ncbi:MAG: cytochrome c maturation protein CcmE, partial [Polyangiaceae bacterium]
MDETEEPKAVDQEAEEDRTPLPVRRGRKVQADPQASRRGLMLVIPLVMAAAAVTALALGGMKDNAIYLKPIDEVIANKAKFAGRPVRAEGNLVHGTLVKRDSPCEYRFTIEKKGVEVPVRYAQCVVPDTFRDVPG